MGAGGMAQLEKMLAAKLDKLSWTPRTHVEERTEHQKFH